MGAHPGDAGVVDVGPALKNRLEFEGPRFVGQLPGGMVPQNGDGLLIIRFVVGAKKQVGALPCPFCQQVQKFHLQEPVFMMPALGPGIREKDKYARKSDRAWERFQQQAGFGLHEGEIGEARAMGLFLRPVDAIRQNINSQAMLLGMGLGIGRQKVTVAAADLERDDLRPGRPEFRQMDVEFCRAGGVEGLSLGEGHI